MTGGSSLPFIPALSSVADLGINPATELQLEPLWNEGEYFGKGLTGQAGLAVRQSRTMASARKPVIVRKFSRDWCAGYADPVPAQQGAELEILDTTGKVLRIAWDQVKWVCYVRDLPGATTDAANPERLLHKKFSVRPRAAGVWLRMTLSDGDELEGLAANDLSLVAGSGLLLTPPDTRSNTQRIYIPRQALQSLEVVSLIGASRRGPAQKLEQPELFENSER